MKARRSTAEAAPVRTLDTMKSDLLADLWTVDTSIGFALHGLERALDAFPGVEQPEEYVCLEGSRHLLTFLRAHVTRIINDVDEAAASPAVEVFESCARRRPPAVGVGVGAGGPGD